jgi:hypothetical protein
MKWLVRMGFHSPMVVNGDTLEEAEEEFAGRLMTMGLEPEPATFDCLGEEG